MSAGDKEIIQVSEEVMRRNVAACVQHGNETRRLVRDLENKVIKLEQALINKTNEISALRAQLAVVQQRVYAGGT